MFAIEQPPLGRGRAPCPLWKLPNKKAGHSPGPQPRPRHGSSSTPAISADHHHLEIAECCRTKAASCNLQLADLAVEGNHHRAAAPGCGYGSPDKLGFKLSKHFSVSTSWSCHCFNNSIPGNGRSLAGPDICKVSLQKKSSLACAQQPISGQGDMELAESVTQNVARPVSRPASPAGLRTLRH